jgi:hypothetical protein
MPACDPDDEGRQQVSVRIGEVQSCTDPGGQPAAYISASTGGVEVFSDERITIDPVQARNYAALLVRAADEVERMRSGATGSSYTGGVQCTAYTGNFVRCALSSGHAGDHREPRINPMFCEHANEAPTGACPCPANCYCRTRTCEGLK